jgi:hypothetical protein
MERLKSGESVEWIKTTLNIAVLMFSSTKTTRLRHEFSDDIPLTKRWPLVSSAIHP